MTWEGYKSVTHNTRTYLNMHSMNTESCDVSKQCQPLTGNIAL